jgi:hypothetical protein
MVCPTPGASAIWKALSAALVLGLIAVGWFVSRHQPQQAPATPQTEAPPPVPAVKPDEASPAPAPASGKPPEPQMVDLGGGRIGIGAVTLDRKTREITIPAAVNMREGPVEYVLVGRNGKVHEAVFTTDAAARDIHVAALLLGVKPESDLGPDQSAAVVRREGAVVIRVEWDRNGPPEKIFLNETVNLSDPSTGTVSATLPSGAWLYNGSRIEPDGVFAATRHASIISIIRDDDALVNNPGASRDNDEIHTPNAAKLPKLGHPVRIVLRVN